MLSLSQCLPVYSFYLSHALFVFKSVIFQLIYFSSSAFYRTFLCNYIYLSLFLFPRYASHISILLPTIHNGGDIYAVSNCLRQSVCLPVSACLSLSVWLFPDLIDPVISFNLPSCFFSVFVYFLRLSVLSACFICFYLYLCLFFCTCLEVSLFLTHTHADTINQSVNQLFFSLQSLSWSPSVCLSCLFFCLSLFLSHRHTYAHTHSLAYLPTHSHSLTNSLNHSLPHLLFYACMSFCLSLFDFVYPFSFYLTHSLTHSLTFTVCLSLSVFLSSSLSVCIPLTLSIFFVSVSMTACFLLLTLCLCSMQ